MKICDAHLHFGDPKELEPIASHSPLRQQFPCYRTVQYGRMDDYEQRFEEHQVEKSVLIPFVFRELDKTRESMRVIEYAKRFPGRYFPYALLDEEDPSFIERNYRDCVGLKEHLVMHKTELTPVRKEIFACLQAHDMVLLLHTNRDSRVTYVSEIVRDFPRLKIQVAHLGRGTPGDIPFILNVIDSLRRFENVFFDTSTIREPEALSSAVDLVGAERILYGSDFPFYMDGIGAEDIMGEQILHIKRAGLSGQEQKMIFSGNFERLITFGKE